MKPKREKKGQLPPGNMGMYTPVYTRDDMVKMGFIPKRPSRKP